MDYSVAPTGVERMSRRSQSASFNYRLVTWISVVALLAEMVVGQTPATNLPVQKKAAAPAGSISQIQHIVFILKENRTFDTYFGTYPGADGASTALISSGRTIHLGHTPDPPPRDISGHGWFDAVNGMDGGRMDHFDLIPGSSTNGDFMGLSQLAQKDIPNYFKYAQNFVLGDRMFSSLQGASFANHLYMVAGQSGGAFTIPVSGGLTPKGAWGCDSPPDTTVKVRDDDSTISSPFPCLEFQTLTDVLDDAGVSWKYYAPAIGQPGAIYSSLDAINHIRFGSEWQDHVVSDTQFAIDAQNGTLPAVSWLVTADTNNEHLHHVGRFWGLLRSRSPAGGGFFWPRPARAAARDLTICEKRIHFSHGLRIFVDSEIYRNALSVRFAHRSRCPGQRHDG
jgi:phospholipase C